jgi:hypothetical protein
MVESITDDEMSDIPKFGIFGEDDPEITNQIQPALVP